MYRFAARPGEGPSYLPVNTLMGKDLAVRRRLVRGMARQLGVELTAAQTDGVLALGSSGAMNLPGGLQAFRQAHRLTIRRLPPAPAPLVLHLGEQSWGREDAPRAGE